MNTDNDRSNNNKIAALVFSQGLPTKSIHEKNIEKIYGVSGLNLQPADLIIIKQTYCYLEFLIKLEKVKNDTMLAQYKTDFKDYLVPNSKHSPLMPNQALVDSVAWQAISITSQDLVDSSMWQTFLKAMVTDSFDNDTQFIIDSTQTNNQIFPYIPNVETAYYTQDFSKLRLYQESIEIQNFIQSEQRQRYLAQCNDWKNIDQNKIMEAVRTFKTEPFYTYTHIPQPPLSLNPADNKKIIISSPTSEQIICYFMLIHIQTIMYDMITKSNLQSILDTTNSTELLPNFFFYNKSDFVLLYDILILQKINDQNNTAISACAITMNPTPPGGIMLFPDGTGSSDSHLDNSVKIQSTSESSPIQSNPKGSDVQAQATQLIFQQLPTISSYETIIEKIYGSAGLNIATEQLINLKKTYCYLEFLVKINKVNNNPDYAQYKSDFQEFLQANTDDKPRMPTEKLVTSKGWQGITVSNNDIILSTQWQNFLKAMVCDCHDSQTNFIIDSTQVNNQMFQYIPNVETGYATHDFTQMRLYSESIELYTLMQGQQKQVYLQQCSDWKNIDQIKIDEALAAFKKSDFYNYTHNSQVSTQKISIDFHLKEEIIAYFLLITMQNNIYKMLNLENLTMFLDQASSPSLSPNLFTYSSLDFACFSDFLVLKNLMKQNAKNPKKSIVTMRETLQNSSSNQPALSDQVIVQAIKDPFKELERGFKKSIIDPTKKSIIDPINKNFKKDFADPAMKALRSINAKSINKGINDGFKAMVSGVIIFSNDLATGFVETCAGITWLSCSFGDALGIKNDPNKEARLVKSKMNAHKAIISSVLGTVFIVAASVVLVFFTAGMAGYALGAAVAGLFIGAAITDRRLGGQLKKYIEEPLMKGMMGIMQGMEAMTDAFTVGFIEMSVGLTWLGCSVGQACGLKINPEQQANAVRAKLEKYRSTINIVMSVVITIIITAVVIMITAGLGAAQMAAIDAGLFGAEAAAAAAQTAAVAAAASASSSAATLTTATAAESLAIIAARQAAQQAASFGTKQAAATVAQAATKQAAATAARKAAELSAKQAADVAAQTTAKAVARRVAIQASDDLAAKQAEELTARVLVKQATSNLARNSSNQAAVKAQEQAAAKLTQATLDRQAAELVAKQTANNSVTQSAKLTALKSTQGVSKQASSTTVLAETSNPMEESQAISSATDNSVAAVTKTQAQQVADKTIADFTSKASGQLATKQAESMVGDAAEIAAKEAARLQSRSVFQVAQEEGMLNAIRGGIMSWSFLIGQALNAGFGVFTAMAAVNQDEAAADRQAEEEESIKNLWHFVENNKVTITQQQNQFLDELNKKHQIAIKNQAFGLQYYINFLNGSVDNVQDQIAQLLAQQYIQMLTPDNNGLRSADIGSTWGLQTQFHYLYPAQGFISTTLGRPDFPYAQEVAQAPLASESHTEKSTDLSDNQSAATKLWFNQRAVSVVNQKADQPLNVEIKFRVIYNLTTAYHIGLYLGGNYHDYNSPDYLKSLQSQGEIDINEAHLAKMFVLKRDDKDTAPSLGLYENEGKGWIFQQPVDQNTLDNGSIYHMSAKLNKDQLIIAFWSENNPSKVWTNTVTVTPSDQRTFGVIFSGLAIEWDVVQPHVSIVQNQTARVESNGQSEIDRERASKAQWKRIMNPAFGSMQMQSAGRSAILQGQYLYRTESTNLTDNQGNVITDYVIFATFTSGVISNIGSSPAPSDSSQTPNAIISLITGNVYDASGTIIAHKQNALDAYLQVYRSLPVTIGNVIAQAASNYQQQLSNYTFSRGISTASNAYNNLQSTQTQVEQVPKQAQVNVISSVTISLNDFANPNPPATAGVQVGLTNVAPSNLVATTGKISQLQTAAAGNATVQLGGLGPVGVDISSLSGVSANTIDTPVQNYVMQAASSTGESGTVITSQARLNSSNITPVMTKIPSAEIDTTDSGPINSVSTNQILNNHFTSTNILKSSLPSMGNNNFALAGSSGFSF
jgi:hypothetical protein